MMHSKNKIFFLSVLSGVCVYTCTNDTVEHKNDLGRSPIFRGAKSSLSSIEQRKSAALSPIIFQEITPTKNAAYQSALTQLMERKKQGHDQDEQLKQQIIKEAYSAEGSRDSECLSLPSEGFDPGPDTTSPIGASKKFSSEALGVQLLYQANCDTLRKLLSLLQIVDRKGLVVGELLQKSENKRKHESALNLLSYFQDNQPQTEDMKTVLGEFTNLFNKYFPPKSPKPTPKSKKRQTSNSFEGYLVLL